MSKQNKKNKNPLNKRKFYAIMEVVSFLIIGALEFLLCLNTTAFFIGNGIFILGYIVTAFVLPIIFGLKSDNLMCFIGSLGMGKTRLASSIAVKRFLFTTKLCGVLRYLPFAYKFFDKQYYPNAKLYSTIPLMFKNKIISVPLTRDIILMKTKIEEGSVVFIDEIGQVASQWQYDNPLVMRNIQCFIRFFRHFVDGFIVCTDQSETNIVKQIRCRLNKVYHIDKQLKLPFSNRYVFSEMVYNENNSNTMVESIVVWYRFDKRIKYDSRCYSNAYFEGFVLDPTDNVGLKTNYFIDVSTTKDSRKEYRDTQRDLVQKGDFKID